MTDLATRIRHGLVEYADATPVPAPPPFVAPEPPRRHRLGPALVAAAVAVTVLAVMVPIVGGGGRGPGFGATEAPASLPDEFAGYSITTGSVSDDPPGRVIACFVYNTERAWNPPQVAVLAADSDRYRVVTAADAGRPPLWQRRPVLLSGDGERLAVGSDVRAVSSIPVVDLVSGDTAEYAVDPGSRVDLLAFSPDGRWLAYATRPFQESAFPDLHARGGRLMVLDLHSGQAGPVDAPGIPASVAQAAFSPDGSLLAVQAGGPDGAEHRQGFGEEVVIVRFVDAQVVATVPVASYYRIAGPAAWTPDASRLALVADGYVDRGQVGPWLRTLERTPDGAWEAGPPVGEAVRDALFLGWQSRDRLVLDADVGAGRAIVLADLGGALVHVLSRPEVEVRSDLSVISLQLAYSLLPDLQIRPAGPPDRGPWPVWLQAGVAVLTLLALGTAAAVALVVRARLRIRRRRS